MKFTKHMMSTALLLCGAIALTYATTRYFTTLGVLTKAQARMDASLREMGVFDDLYNRHIVGFSLAIPQAGGMY